MDGDHVDPARAVDGQHAASRAELLVVTSSLCPKWPVESNVMPVGATVAASFAKRLAWPFAPISMTPGRRPGWIARPSLQAAWRVPAPRKDRQPLPESQSAAR